MPYESVVDLLIKKGAPKTNTDWVALVEARKNFMMEEQRVKQLAQKTFGSVNHWSSRADIGPQVSHDLVRGRFFLQGAPKGFSLSTRGVFIFDSESYIEQDSCGVTYAHVYGFTRGGEWVIARINFRLNGSRMENKMVEVRQASPLYLIEPVGMSPRRIFTELGCVIEQHAKNRRELLRKAEEDEQDIKSEDNLLAKFCYQELT